MRANADGRDRWFATSMFISDARIFAGGNLRGIVGWNEGGTEGRRRHGHESQRLSLKVGGERARRVKG